MSFSGAALVDVDPGVQILSRGGHSGLETVLGGNGGNFRAVSMDLFATLVFDGSANIRGGRTVTAREGDLGAYCVSGAISSQTEANIIGLNTFAPCRCNDATVESLADVTNELDNLDSTIRHDTLITETNVLSVRAFRIDPDLTVDMEISVNGTASTDIDISVADGDFLATVRVCGLPVLDLRLPANYFDAAAAAPHGANIEILTIGAGSRQVSSTARAPSSCSWWWSFRGPRETSPSPLNRDAGNPARGSFPLIRGMRDVTLESPWSSVGTETGSASSVRNVARAARAPPVTSG